VSRSPTYRPFQIVEAVAHAGFLRLGIEAGRAQHAPPAPALRARGRMARGQPPRANGEQVQRVSKLALSLGRGKSVDFSGSWPRRVK
jgi:hypothetical protein